MISYETVCELLSVYEDVSKDYPFNKNIEVYSLDEIMFALIYKDLSPIQISLRCDRLLAKHLKEKYETVSSAKDLNPKQWITVILTGQLSEEEIKDLIRHSFELAKQAK
ncbi:MAG: MmcQ/YjbR family DNA-binding protein [Candidatus Saccharibacteria bacterium]